MVGSAMGALVIGNVNDNGTLTAGGAPSAPGEISFINSNNLILNSKIVNNGAAGVMSATFSGTQSGGSTVASLFGTNTYSGGTTMTNGQLVVVNACGLGLGPVTILNGAQTSLTVSGTYVNQWNLAGSGTNGALQIGSSNITLLNDASIGNNFASTVLTGAITGA